MSILEQVKFLAENYIYSAALNKILESDGYFAIHLEIKAKLLLEAKPEPKSPEYGTWDAACSKFFKSF